MACTMMRRCNACRGEHVLILLDADRLDALKRYEYTCPKNGAVVQIESGDADWWKATQIRPRAAVILRAIE